MLIKPLPQIDETLQQQIRQAFLSNDYAALRRLVIDNRIYKVPCNTCGDTDLSLRSWIAYLMHHNFKPSKYL